MKLQVYRSALLCLLAVIGAATAEARTLQVGPKHSLKAPSQAAKIAADGDVIEIDSGEYFDCAVWSANRLRIVGKGSSVVLTDKACDGKAIFVIQGNDVHIENLTFTRARVPDANGAGIRAEGMNLVVDSSRFINNENGILSNNNDQSVIQVRKSEFVRNGKCEGSCAHGIYINAAKLLRIEDSKFFETKSGHHIKSRAQRTEIVRVEIRDGTAGTSSYLIDIPNGGSLLVEDSVLEKGAGTTNRSAAIMIGAEGVTQPTQEIIVRRNRFEGNGPNIAAFLVNRTATEAQLIANQLSGAHVAIVGDGAVH